MKMIVEKTVSIWNSETKLIASTVEHIEIFEGTQDEIDRRFYLWARDLLCEGFRFINRGELIKGDCFNGGEISFHLWNASRITRN